MKKILLLLLLWVSTSHCMKMGSMFVGSSSLEYSESHQWIYTPNSNLEQETTRVGLPHESSYDGPLHCDLNNQESFINQQDTVDYAPTYYNTNESDLSREVDQVTFNEFEAKIIEGQGHELQHLRKEYEDKLNQWYRILGRGDLREDIRKIDNINPRFKDHLIKDFYVIKHGNTEEVKEALCRLKAAQIARSQSPNCFRYPTRGLLRNQYKLAFVRAIKRPDDHNFKYIKTNPEDIIPVADQNLIIDLIKKNNAQLNIYQQSSIKLLTELNAKDIKSIESMLQRESEFKKIVKNSLSHYFYSLWQNNPFSDQKQLVITGVHIGAALVCNMIVPGSSGAYYGSVTAINMISHVLNIDTEHLSAEQVANFAAEQAATATWNLALNKATKKVSQTIDTLPAIKESIQNLRQNIVRLSDTHIEMNQPGNIVISGKNKIPLITKLPHPQATFPEGVSQLKHIFADRPGHMINTPINRQRLLSIIDPKNYCGPDKPGNSCYEYILPSGQQLWVQVFENGIITNGGLNNTPIKYNPKTGFSALVKPTTNRKKE